jgi:hypothetical protein
MGLDLWFREDVARMLASAHETLRASAGALSASDSESAEAYQQGFTDALRAVGIAFGVAVPGPPATAEPTRHGRWCNQVVDADGHRVR